jgi:hypothetical protein
MHEIRKAAPQGSAPAACLEKSMRLVDAYIKVCLDDDDCFPNALHELAFLLGPLQAPANWIAHAQEIRPYGGATGLGRGTLQAFFNTDVAQLGEWMARHPEYSQEHKQALGSAIAEFKGLKKREKTAFIGAVQACARGE